MNSWSPLLTFSTPYAILAAGLKQLHFTDIRSLHEIHVNQTLQEKMLPEIWEPDLTVVFVGTAVADVSDTIGFPHLHPKDRFWVLLERSGITPNQIITPPERKALVDGHARRAQR